MQIIHKNHEIIFASAGLCGVALYYLLENIALTYTMASNVGVISSIVPFFTAILAYLFLKEEPLRMNFFVGFIIAAVGIFLISFNGFSNFSINPLGDLLAISATLVWAIYTLIARKISHYGYSTIQATRRIFFYGLLFMLPALFLFDFQLKLERFVHPISLLNMLFLGIGASAICFVTWNYAVKKLGAVKTSVYIYLVPIITIVFSHLVLHEQITYQTFLGTILALAGLLISESRMSFFVRRGVSNESAK